MRALQLQPGQPAGGSSGSTARLPVAAQLGRHAVGLRSATNSRPASAHLHCTGCLLSAPALLLAQAAGQLCNMAGSTSYTRAVVR